METAARGGATVAVACLLVTTLGYVAFGSAVTRTDTIGVCDDSVYAISFVYQGNASGFLWPTFTGEVSPGACEGETVQVGGSVSVIAFVHSSDTTSSHEITSLVVAPPFKLASLQPTVPSTIAAGGNLTFQVSVIVPPTPGEYGAPSVTMTAI